jgi:hypothetical protein
MVLEAVAYSSFNHLTRLLVRESFIEVGSYRTTYHRKTLPLIDSFCDQEGFITHPTLPSRLLYLPEIQLCLKGRHFQFITDIQDAGTRELKNVEK